jgi:hypothetical protein
MQFLPKLDFYLPRTIMASLLFQELKDAIDTRFFPPDVCCAALYFHLKYRFKREETVIIRFLRNLPANHYNKKIDSVQFHYSVKYCKINVWYISK